MADPLDLSGRVALVTGGAQGTGHGIATRFLAAGADVVVCDRTDPADVPENAGRAAVFLAADVRQPEEVDGLVTAIEERFGHLDITVNDASDEPGADGATAADIVALHLLGPLHVAQRANAVMQRQDSGGSIMNITALSGLRPSPGAAAYGAAQAGLINLTQTLAVEWAPKVRVNSVSAGLIEVEDAEERLAATVPLGRLAAPGDVAGACLFLASPLSSYVSGANLVLHGGGERPAFLDAVTAD